MLPTLSNVALNRPLDEVQHNCLSYLHFLESKQLNSEARYQVLSTILASKHLVSAPNLSRKSHF